MCEETLRDHYRRLFGTTDYNQRTVTRGQKFFELVKGLLLPPIVDLGCGRGLFVQMARENGLDCDGVDWVEGCADLVADITEPLDLSRYRTATAFDVLEHIPQDRLGGATACGQQRRLRRLDGLLANLASVPRFVVTIHNGPSRKWLGRELHVTRMSWPEWRSRLEGFLVIEGEMVPWPARKGKRRLFYGRPH